MKRGSTTKRETSEGMALERKMITRRYSLELLRRGPGGGCIGCQVCALVCPQEAIEFRPGLVDKGTLIQDPTVDIDPDKCNFCGECVVLCPVNALHITVNGEPEVPVLQYEAFPNLIKEISADGARLLPEAATVCEASCPTEVIRVQVERDDAGEAIRVRGIQVDECANRESAGCIYCQQCQVAFPEVFAVTKPWAGRVRLDITRCPEGCRACADICPTDALRVKQGTVAVDERSCLYCGACQQVCPVEGAILVERSRILHTPIKSAAWTSALARLISVAAAAQELDAKSQAKRRQVLAYLPSIGRGAV
jgi:4Fe-4S ferredoxin